MPSSSAVPGTPIPAFVNPAGGSAAAAREAVAADPRFVLREVAPDALAGALGIEVARGTPRVAVAGGDGTVAAAAAALARTGTALAVLPGGTLNHFARDLGLPVDDLPACLEVAATAETRHVDVAYVNDRLVLGTSGVGTYVVFVRARERLERAGLGYRLATVLAAARSWLALRGFDVEVRAPTGVRRCRTPQVAVGVGERATSRPGLGARVVGGRRALHVVVVRETARARLAAMVLTALARGTEAMERAGSLESMLVDECTVAMRRPWGTVAADGELLRIRSPLHYRIERDALAVVAPEDAAQAT